MNIGCVHTAVSLTQGQQCPGQTQPHSGSHTSEHTSTLPSEGLFTLLQAYDIPSYSEGGAVTNTNKRDVVRMELHKPSLLWKFLLLLCPYHRWAPAAAERVWTCRQSPGDSSGKQLSVCHAQPSSFIGPRWTFSPWEMLNYPLPMPSPSEPSSHPACWNWKIHQLLSVCPGSQCAHSSLLLSTLFLQFSSVWISLQPFFPVPHYIHIHPH